jgi:hypothetical protein
VEPTTIHRWEVKQTDVGEEASASTVRDAAPAADASVVSRVTKQRRRRNYFLRGYRAY